MKTKKFSGKKIKIDFIVVFWAYSSFVFKPYNSKFNNKFYKMKDKYKNKKVIKEILWRCHL